MKTKALFNHCGCNFQVFAENKGGVWRNIHIHQIFAGSKGFGFSFVDPAEPLVRVARRALIAAASVYKEAV